MHQFGSLSDIVIVLKRRLPLIVALTLLGCLASIYFALQAPQTFETTAVVQLEDARVIDARTGQTDAAQRLQLLEQRMMARDNLIDIIETFGLFADDDLSIGRKVSELRNAARITMITDAAQPWSPQAHPTGLVITVTLDDAEMAAAVANELLARVIATGTSRQAETAQETLDFFRAEETRLAADMTALEAQISRFKQTNAAALPEAVAAQRASLAALETSDLTIEREIIGLQSAARSRTDNSDQIALLEQQRALVRDRISGIQTQILSAPQVEQELSLLNRRLTLLQDEFSVVTRRRAEAETSFTLQANQQTERFEVLETALVPDQPVSRSKKRTAMMGGVVSMVLAFGVAFVLELLFPAIRTPAQLERALGVQPVIAIPKLRSRANRRRRALGWAGFGGLVVAALGLLVLYLPDRLAALLPFYKGDRQAARL